MSRTRRKGYIWKYEANGNAYTYGQLSTSNLRLRECGWTGHAYYRKDLRDGNDEMMTSPPKWFKRLRARKHRRRMDAAVRDGRQMPRFKNSDKWDWW